MTTSLWNTIVTLYEGVVETSLKSMWHSHDFNGRSETNQDVTSHNVKLRYYLAGSTYPKPSRVCIISPYITPQLGKPSISISINIPHINYIQKYMIQVLLI